MALVLQRMPTSLLLTFYATVLSISFKMALDFNIRAKEILRIECMKIL